MIEPASQAIELGAIQIRTATAGSSRLRPDRPENSGKHDFEQETEGSKTAPISLTARGRLGDLAAMSGSFEEVRNNR
jgi:hypothetical protein